MMEDEIIRVPTTLSIDPAVKRKFKIECIKNSVEMSETVEMMMLDYVKVSNQIHSVNATNGEG